MWGLIVVMLAFPIIVMVIAVLIFPGDADHVLDHLAGYDR